MDRSLLFRAVSVSAGILALVAACTSGGSGDTPPSTQNEAGVDSSSTTSDATTTDDRSVNPPQGKFSFTGVFDDPTLPPTGSKVAVLWNVFSGSPDYSYVFGGGTTSGAEVYVTFTTDPPAEALNGNKIGIGLVYVVDAAFDLPEGKLTNTKSDASPENALKGISARHAVIFRNGAEQVTSAGWDLAFPQGFACGVCEDRETGFDAFIPIDCSQVKVVPFVKGTTKTCNFT